jgi:hypothetical protein
MTGRLLLAAAAMLAVATPARATQGMLCSGKGMSIHLLFGNAAVPGLVSAQLNAGETVVPSAIARSWSDQRRIWVDLADPDQMALIASLRLVSGRRDWHGHLTYQGRRVAVRCEEA